LNQYGTGYTITSVSEGDEGLDAADRSRKLSFPVNDIQTSLIRIEIETEGRISFIKNIPTGEILEALMVNN
jgi:hypothetical protein